MKQYIHILNVFCLLSLLSVGGGSAVLPQMEHETVANRHWVTGDQFAAIYSLGQMAPGPNMSMVGLVGYKAAGFVGMIIALIAFYLPSSFLVYGCSFVWDQFKDNPWRNAVQEGMAPITIGLMLSGVYAVGKTASISSQHSLHHNSITAAITLAVTVILFAKHINPALLMLVGGVIGCLALRGI